ncbi:hypothetical protein PPTG_21417 [Phytophthora nicotianae INRA-310]|uniref:Retroviral polymerase SH3-like domain-containing protein n=1 Tax=Phytophthora nicotianae (strain INRA-310) TaxID=761204 RepID=W2R345_PHYN3|nr:hypothetical protein PPTG_21417 [Phytophthora nicotianae INRA-310]ETN19144.1 hypothetical protein PPTG_21417 [Phytophthora nicotianae INRA-310]
MHYKGVSTEWWAEAVSTAVYLTNRSTNSLHPTRTLYELVYQSRPRLDHLRVFGSMGYAHVDKTKRTKLEPKSFKCLFLGYADDSKGYRVFDLESNKVKMSRSVRLEEREVDGIYDTTPNEDSVTILVSKDDDVAAIPDANEHSTEDVPMEIPERDVEEADMPEADMPGDELTTYRGLGRPMSESMVFRPEPRRAQRAREPSRPRLDHLRVFGSMGYAHVDKTKRTKLEPKSFKCLFLGYADDSKGYRVFDLESNKVKMSRSVRLEEREVDGIYDTTPNEDSVTILVSKDDDVAAIPDANEHSTEDVPMEIPERDVEEADMPEADMPGDELTTYRGLGRPMSESMVFRPEPRRAQRAREPVLLLVDGSTNDDKSKVNGDDDPNHDDHFWPPFPKRPRVDEDCLLAEAVLEYPASVGDANDAPTTYQRLCRAARPRSGSKPRTRN